jgi:hypothetical protein
MTGRLLLLSAVLGLASPLMGAQRGMWLRARSRNVKPP